MQFPESDLPGDPGRRQFLRVGFWGGIALSTISAASLLSGCSSAPLATGLRLFRETDVKVLRALVPVVLAGEIEAGPTAVKTVDDTITALDDFLYVTSNAGHKQIHQLFDLLGMPFTRYAVAGLHEDWDKASPADIEGFLLRWRESRFQMLRGGYMALTQIINMTWYMQPRSWAVINYVPPRVVA